MLAIMTSLCFPRPQFLPTYGRIEFYLHSLSMSSPPCANLFIRRVWHAPPCIPYTGGGHSRDSLKRKLDWEGKGGHGGANERTAWILTTASWRDTRCVMGHYSWGLGR
jgi:hypothetical protein